MAKKNRSVEENIAEFEVEEVSTPSKSPCSCDGKRDIACVIHGG